MKFNIDVVNQHCSGVYAIKSLVTDDMYIGSTNDFLARYSKHIHRITKTAKFSKINDFILKHGINSLSFEVLEILTCDKVELRKKEQFYIDLLQPSFNTNKAFGNKTYSNSFPNRHFSDKSWLGKKHLESSKIKISLAMPRKRVRMTNILTQEYEDFDCMMDIKRKYNFSGVGHICAVCKGKIKSYMGYYFEYI